MDIQISIEEDGSGEDDSGPIIVKHERKNSSLEQLIPSYTFKRLIVGEHNNLAIAAAQKVAQNPGTAYNPLFLFGGVGLGKTHLMHAVGHELLKKDINTNVACVTSEEFMNLFIDSIRNKRQALFRKKFRTVDIFLLDDVQFLLRSGETRNELFNTFNTLHQKKKQIILTSDRSLKQLGLDGLDDRLVSRLGWGLDVEIHTPSIETKQAILYAKADGRRFHPRGHPSSPRW
jgi:chromosomal replication initiator protein